MEIIYTEHAKEQLQIRKILEIWVEETVHWPDSIRHEGTTHIARKRINGKSIEIVFEKEKYIKIITLYWN